MTITILGVPYDASSSAARGSAGGPAAIRAAWERSLLYSNQYTESGLNLGAERTLRDAGDVAVADPPDPAAVRRGIEEAVTQLLVNGEHPLLLGGDHSITYPALRAFHKAYGRLEVLHFDAHPDLYPVYQGDRYSHACPFARALEDGLVSRLVQVGIRASTPPQQILVAEHGVEQLPMKDWGRPMGLFFDGPVYVSFDLDVLDPAFAPGVAHPEPGGLSIREAIGLLQRVHGSVVGADLVECNPALDRDGRTAAVAVKLIKELAGLLAGRHG